MSKLDAQRAMREAKYARQQATTAPRRKVAEPPVAPPLEKGEAKGTERATAKGAAKAPRKTAKKAAAPAAETTETGLCGHKSMNGRACTRPAGHSEKSHRYA